MIIIGTDIRTDQSFDTGKQEFTQCPSVPFRKPICLYLWLVGPEKIIVFTGCPLRLFSNCVFIICDNLLYPGF